MRSVRNPVERRAAPIKSRLRDEGCVDDLQRVNKTYRGRMADVSALCTPAKGSALGRPALRVADGEDLPTAVFLYEIVITE
ncbi:MAG: hypothetical protein OXH88_04895 [Gammaproteobacteria bacterium]|nr:hypothetical protein [Gammaproteobacteria bacterium]